MKQPSIVEHATVSSAASEPSVIPADNTADAGERVAGSIWNFDPAEGAAFIQCINPGPIVYARTDIFLAAGFQRALPGALVQMRILENKPYWEAIEIVSLDESTAIEPTRLRQAGEVAPESAWCVATCQRFDWLRGFGFLTLEDGTRVRVDSPTAKRSGLVRLTPEQKVFVVWGRSGHGKVAAELKPYPAPRPPLNCDTADYSKGRVVLTGSVASQTSANESVGLGELAGMDEAVAWGEALAKDLADYRANKIVWRDVDPGALLHGPPGTGKTMFARALSVTCRVPLIATSYSDWQRTHDGYLGDVHRAIDNVFDKAKDASPSILFIDELDTVPARGANRHNDAWWTSIVNALLEQLDGIKARDGVVVLGACNNASIIDPAILRAGRLDRMIPMPLPSTEALAKILAFHLGEDAKRVKVINDLALLCGGMTGADVARLVREARRSARHAKRDVRTKDLMRAIECDGAIDKETRRRAAIHESGHAIAALVTGFAGEVSVSLVARDGRAGQTSFVQARAKPLTIAFFERAILVHLAGRAAEAVLLGNVSAGSGGGVHSDLAKATQLATDMVLSFGLGRSLLWSGSIRASDEAFFESSASIEIEAILDRSYRKAVGLIEQHSQAVRAVASQLARRRALAHEDVARILRAYTGSQGACATCLEHAR